VWYTLVALWISQGSGTEKLDKLGINDSFWNHYGEKGAVTQANSKWFCWVFLWFFSTSKSLQMKRKHISIMFQRLFFLYILNRMNSDFENQNFINFQTFVSQKLLDQSSWNLNMFFTSHLKPQKTIRKFFHRLQNIKNGFENFLLNEISMFSKKVVLIRRMSVFRKMHTFLLYLRNEID